AEGKDDTGFALVRTGSGSAPDAGVRPEELEGRVLVATDLTAEEGTRLSSTKPDVVHDIELTGSMADYDWGLNGRVYDHENPTAGAFTVTQGQRVRLVLTNTTDMWHPMHLHGNDVQIGEDWPRKDTLIVLPGQTLTCDFDADNPGLWMTHCHNLYPGESGMMGVVAYTACSSNSRRGWARTLWPSPAPRRRSVFMPITPASVFRSLALLPSLAMLTACAATASDGTDSSSISEQQSAWPTEIQHVHAIVANPDGDGWVLGTHQGIFYVSEDGEVESVGPVMDFM